MATISGSFGAAGASASLYLRASDSQQVLVHLSGTYAATVKLQRLSGSGGAWETLYTWSAANGTVRYRYQPENPGETLRLLCSSYTSGTVLYSAIQEGKPLLRGEGQAAGDNTFVEEQVFPGGIHYTTLTFNARAITVTDALAYAGTKIYDFPEGRILVLGAHGSLQFAVTTDRTTTINASAAMDWSVGSVTASSITLASTMIDLIPKVDNTLDGTNAALATLTSGQLAASAQFNGTATPLDAFLNVSFPTNTEIDADGTLEVTGQIVFVWVNLGDV